MADPDVLVIGSGVAGLFCAYHLRRAGLSVTVVDGGQIGGPQSCSSRNTGFVGTQGAVPLAEPGVLRQGLRWLGSARSPFSITPRPSPALISWLWHFRRLCTEADAQRCYRVLLDMKRRSLAILREACADGELAGTLTQAGMIVAFKTERAFARARASVPAATEAGVPLRVIDGAELGALEPDVGFDVSGALFNAEGAALAVPRFLTCFASQLAAIGVGFVPGARVTGFRTAPDVAGRRRVSQVRTTRGDFAPAEVIIAAGAWSGRCARMLGVRLALQPAKGYTVTVCSPAAAPRHPVLLSEGKVAVAPSGGTLRLGGTLQLAGFSTSKPRRRIDGIVATVRSYLPDLPIGEDREVWTGLRPCTPDSLPYIGRAGSFGNLTLACGHGYIGMGLAPAGGQLAAQVITGEDHGMDAAPFRPGRFGGS